MYALFVLSVHVYYVNCNAKTQMGYLCVLINKIYILISVHVNVAEYLRNLRKYFT